MDTVRRGLPPVLAPIGLTGEGLDSLHGLIGGGADQSTDSTDDAGNDEDDDNAPSDANPLDTNSDGVCNKDRLPDDYGHWESDGGGPAGMNLEYDSNCEGVHGAHDLQNEANGKLDAIPGNCDGLWAVGTEVLNPLEALFGYNPTECEKFYENAGLA